MDPKGSQRYRTYAIQGSLLNEGKMEMGGKHLERQTGDKFCVLKIELGHLDTMGRAGGFGNRK